MSMISEEKATIMEERDVLEMDCSQMEMRVKKFESQIASLKEELDEAQNTRASSEYVLKQQLALTEVLLVISCLFPKLTVH